MQHDVSANAWQPAARREGPLKAAWAALSEAINPVVELIYRECEDAVRGSSIRLCLSVCLSFPVSLSLGWAPGVL